MAEGGFEAAAEEQEAHKALEEEEEESSVLPSSLSSYFLSSDQQPKHVGAGAAQALAHLGAGVLGGVGTLLAAPVIGAKEEGALGFAKGLGAGLVGAVALPVLGVASAAKSLAQGAANTPAAVQASAEGKEWDAQRGEWRLYDLKEECDEVLKPGADDVFAERRRLRRRRAANKAALEEQRRHNATTDNDDNKDLLQGGGEGNNTYPSHHHQNNNNHSSSSTSSHETAFERESSSSRESSQKQEKKEKPAPPQQAQQKTDPQRRRRSFPVKDRSLYDALRVEPDASDAEIKKGYYRAALKYHPDKNRDDPSAPAKFQQIGRAYQILSNKAARRRYDELGDGDALNAASESHAMMDAATFFAMVFGSEAFEQYVGELRLATTMKKSMQREEEDEAFYDNLATTTTAATATSQRNDDNFDDDDFVDPAHSQSHRTPPPPPTSQPPPVQVATADVDADELSFEQRKREVTLAKNLAEDVLRDYVEGRVSELEFSKATRRKADDLASTPFGATLLVVIARSYAVAGQRHLASGTTADFSLALLETAHDASTRYHVVRDAVRAVASTRAAQRSDDELTRFHVQQQETSSSSFDEAGDDHHRNGGAGHLDDEAKRGPRDDDDLFATTTSSSNGRQPHCEDAADVERSAARYMIVHSDPAAAGGWKTRHFYRLSSAEARWVKLPYSETAVLFERRHSWWHPSKEYGYLDVERIKVAVADANPKKQRDDDSTNAPRNQNPSFGGTSNSGEAATSRREGALFTFTPQKAAESMSKANHVRMMAAVVEAAWRISVVDIDSTLRAATKKLLNDHSVEQKVRDKRAKGLILIAQSFDSAVNATGHQESWQDQLARQIRGMGVGFRASSATTTTNPPEDSHR